MELKYPTINVLTRHIFELSQQSSEPIFLYKEDMDRAFRQLFACPSSVPLLGFKWRGQYYFDLVMVMGCRIAPYICQRTTDMVAHIQGAMGYFVLNYVDDFIGAEYSTRVGEAYQTLIRLLSNIGLDRSEKKSVSPTQVIDFIGNLVDTINMTLGITAARKIEIIETLQDWRHKTMCTRTQLESLIGKLQFLSNCVKPGRLFVSRLLSELRGMERGKWYHIGSKTRKDIRWWYLFIPQFEGTCIMWWLDKLEVGGEMAMDACLIVAGWV